MIKSAQFLMSAVNGVSQQAHLSLFDRKGQQGGQFALGRWTILREPGTARGYFPGRHAAGTRVKFTKGVYEVQVDGSLRRLRA